MTDYPQRIRLALYPHDGELYEQAPLGSPVRSLATAIREGNFAPVEYVLPPPTCGTCARWTPSLCSDYPGRVCGRTSLAQSQSDYCSHHKPKELP